VAETVPSEVPKTSFLDCRIEPVLVPSQGLPLYVNKNPDFWVYRTLLKHLERCERDGTQANVARLSGFRLA
jgi:hypothetical protein